MSCFQRIICAVDFSDASHRALGVAARLVRESRAGLTVLHVQESGAVAAGAPFAPPGHAHAEASAAELAAWKDEAEQLSGSVVSTVVLGAPAAQAIAGFARDVRADLVVVGSHGRTGVRRLVLGSVAEEVARIAPCPVLLVPPQRPEGEAEARAGTDGSATSGMPA